MPKSGSSRGQAWRAERLRPPLRRALTLVREALKMVSSGDAQSLAHPESPALRCGAFRFSGPKQMFRLGLHVWPPLCVTDRYGMR